MMTNRRHALAMVMCVVVLLSAFVSAAYVAHEAAHPHDCAGEDCPICRFIAQINQLRRCFGTVLLALLAVCFALTARLGRGATASADVPALCTPVGRKIRLND